MICGYDIVKDIQNSLVFLEFMSLILNKLNEDFKSESIPEPIINEFIWNKNESPHLIWKVNNKRQDYLGSLYVERIYSDSRIEKDCFLFTFKQIYLDDIKFKINFKKEEINIIEIINQINNKIFNYGR